MNKLDLYMILHGNLNFSAIPETQYSTVLDSCYWPMLELINKGCKMALEFPADTLIHLEKIDPSFIKQLKLLWKEKKCEIYTSGMTQAILPLIPYEVNYKNIQYGLEIFDSILQKRPEIYFLPEQTYSKNLYILLKEFDFKAIIMDWDNAFEYQNYTKEQRYHPQNLKTNDNYSLPVIWNSSMNSYKFQRYIYGRISLTDYVEGIKNHQHPEKNRALCIYGTDWEIFNFRPLTHETNFNEIERVESFFKIIKSYKDINFILPSSLLKNKIKTTPIEITSAEIPIPCKNRDDYNVTRWAVSGRDNNAQNSRCFKTFLKLKNLSSIDSKNEYKKEWQQLIRLWGSDFRTKTTSEKHYAFWTNMGHLEHILNEKKINIIHKTKNTADIIIQNSSDIDLQNEIVEITLKFKQGRFHSLPTLKIKNKEVLSQGEDIQYYADKSIRELLLICSISIKKHETIKAYLVKQKQQNKNGYIFKLNGAEISIKTQHTHFITNLKTGADIRSLTFPNISSIPMIKYLPPVYFDNIAYGNDYFSGWTQLCTEKREIIHDTKDTFFIPDENNFTIRIPLHFKQNFHNGFLIKRYNIYIDRERLDLSNHFYFTTNSPIFLRTGITTFNPEAFNLNKLSCSTTNGSLLPETYKLKGTNINHQRFPTQETSATSALGATQGWLTIHDNHNALSIITDKTNLYSVPMIEFEELEKNYLLRIYNSIAESDDTGKSTFYGHNLFKMSYIGHKISNLKLFTTTKRNSNSPLFMYQNEQNI